MIDEDLAHRPGGDGEKMGAIAGVEGTATGQLHIRFVNESRRLQGVTRPLVPQLASGERAQLVVDQRHQALQGVGLALAGRLYQARHLTLTVSISGVHDYRKMSRCAGSGEGFRTGY